MMDGDGPGWDKLRWFGELAASLCVLLAITFLAGCSQTPTPTPVTVLATEYPLLLTTSVVITEPTTAPTAVATLTPIPVLETIQQATPVLLAAASDRLALAKNDLVYLSQGKLFAWKTGEPTASPLQLSQASPRQSVAAYDLDPLHARMIVLQSRGMVANGKDLFDLVGYDLQSGLTMTLQMETTRLEAIHLSPHGALAAYRDARDLQSVYVQPMIDLSVAIQVWQGQIISDLAWSADSSQLAWSDGSGVWVYNHMDERTRRAVGDTLQIPSLDGQTTPVKVTYNEIAWSPAGRFLSAWAVPAAGSPRRVILDTRTGKAVELPGETWGDAPADTWMADGRLIILRGGEDDISMPAVQVWNVLPANPDLLVLDSEYPLDFAKSPGFADVPPSLFHLILPGLVDGNEYSFLVVNPEMSDAATLARFDLRYSVIDAVGVLPADTRRVTWTPGGGAAVAQSQRGGVFLVLPGDGIFDLLPLLGDGACEAAWLP